MTFRFRLRLQRDTSYSAAAFFVSLKEMRAPLCLCLDGVACRAESKPAFAYGFSAAAFFVSLKEMRAPLCLCLDGVACRAESKPAFAYGFSAAAFFVSLKEMRAPLCLCLDGVACRAEALSVAKSEGWWRWRRPTANQSQNPRSS